MFVADTNWSLWCVSPHSPSLILCFSLRAFWRFSKLVVTNCTLLSKYSSACLWDYTKTWRGYKHTRTRSTNYSQFSVILSLLNRMVFRIQITEINIKKPLAHYNLQALLALSIAYECFITSHQHQAKTSSSWLNYTLLHKMAFLL